jgi:hypothetical protein
VHVAPKKVLVWRREEMSPEVLWEEVGGVCGHVHVHQGHGGHGVTVADLYHVMVWVVKEDLQRTRASLHAACPSSTPCCQGNLMRIL